MTMTQDHLDITVGDGKYRLIQSPSGGLRALRHGEEWRDLVGDSLVLTMAQEIESLRANAVQARAGLLNQLAAECHAANAKWWMDPRTGQRIERNDGEMFMLMVSEIAEAMEGHRKNLMDDKLPHRKMVEVELADVLIRIFDYAGARGLDLDGAVAEKRAFNATRTDHTFEARLAPGGKAY